MDRFEPWMIGQRCEIDIAGLLMPGTIHCQHTEGTVVVHLDTPILCPGCDEPHDHAEISLKIVEIVQ